MTLHEQLWQLEAAIAGRGDELHVLLPTIRESAKLIWWEELCAASRRAARRAQA